MSTKRWYVVVELAPDTAHGVWPRRGLSALADAREAAIEEVLSALRAKHGTGVHFLDAFQFEENEQ